MRGLQLQTIINSFNCFSFSMSQCSLYDAFNSYNQMCMRLPASSMQVVGEKHIRATNK